MNKKRQFLLILLVVLFLLAHRSFSQTTLNIYVQQGLDSNLALKQQSFDLEKAKLDLQRAKALFYPQAGVNAQYTLANGGRSIALPTGDLLNPIYSTLNELTSSTKFPQIQNQNIQFLPNDFQDTKLEFNVPIYNAALQQNKKIKESLITSQQLLIDQYKRELVYDIKTAYYSYLQSAEASSIYENALTTVQESLRLNEKLVKNNVATKEVVLKAKAEVSSVEAQLENARQQKQNAAAYFNFLLNRSLDAPIETDSLLTQSIKPVIQLNATSSQNREELSRLKNGEAILQQNLALNKTYKQPALYGFYNIGFQGYGYKFNDKQFYQLGGLQLKWNIFAGNDNKLKEKQTQVDIEAIQNQYADAEKQILLQVTTTYNTYKAALKSLQSAADEETSTAEVYRLTNARYQNGQALQIELIDARTAMTNAAVKYTLAQLVVLTKDAELERVTASYNLHP